MRLPRTRVELLRGVAYARARLAAAPSDAWFARRASELRRDLLEHAMPFWLSCIDREHGGFRLSETLDEGLMPVTEKHVVSQARLTWVFARMARFAPERPQYLEAAAHGFRFLRERLFDSQFGGYYWTTTPEGQPRVTAKLLCGQVFVLYALAEYSRATGSSEALVAAMDLFALIQECMHDDRNGGWMEHFSREMEPLPAGSPVERGVAGQKSADVHTHIMEAFGLLAEVTGDTKVLAAFREAVAVNLEHFFLLAGGANASATPDWSPAGNDDEQYGHQAEVAWLMVAAQRALGEPVHWTHFDAIMRRALRFAYDWRGGGLFGRGRPGKPVFHGQKIWWVQAEFLAALAYWARTRRGKALGRRVLRQQLNLIERRFMSGPERVWISRMAFERWQMDPWRAESWKAGYHEVRATLEFIEAFERR